MKTIFFAPDASGKPF